MNDAPPRPEVTQLLSMIAAANAPGFAEMSPGDGRAAVSQMVAMLDAPPLAHVATVDYHCDTGAEPFRVRRYAAPGTDEAAPVVVFLHGGGWVVGDVDGYDSFCRFLTDRSGWPVLSVDYRRAPETPFPGAYDDALAAARWATSAVGPFPNAPGIVLAGDSAGGNLAAALAHELVSAGHAVAGQLLFYPVMDVSGQSQSYASFAEGYLLTRRDMEAFIDAYVPRVADRIDPRCSPLLTPDPTMAPPTVVLACGLDPLRDEARAYAARIADAGGRIAYLEAEGMIHGLVTLRGALPSVVAEIERAIALTKLIVEWTPSHD